MKEEEKSIAFSHRTSLNSATAYRLDTEVTAMETRTTSRTATLPQPRTEGFLSNTLQMADRAPSASLETRIHRQLRILSTLKTRIAPQLTTVSHRIMAVISSKIKGDTKIRITLTPSNRRIALLLRITEGTNNKITGTSNNRTTTGTNSNSKHRKVDTVKVRVLRER